MKVYKYLLILLLFSCLAEPTEIDIDRTIKTFLELRFRSNFDKSLSVYSDYELFQLSCKQNRVKCDKLFNLLKERKEEFYNTLIQTKNQ